MISTQIIIASSSLNLLKLVRFYMVIIFDTLSQGINCSSFKSKLLIPIAFVKAYKFTVLPFI